MRYPDKYLIYGIMWAIVTGLLLSPAISLAQQSTQVRPRMTVPQTDKPELDKAVEGQDCPDGFNKVVHGGVRACVKCMENYTYHDYYGQGLCITCPNGTILAEFGGKVMCFSCPSGYRLQRPQGIIKGVAQFNRQPFCQDKSK